jgi:hypothetical protein
MTDEPHISNGVDWFAAKMKEKLRRPKNVAKGAWWEATPEDLFDLLQAEMEELDIQLNMFGPLGIANMEKIIDECCDVANFAMMLADQARRHAEGLARSDEAEA